jgi:hypothetical protein
MGIPAGLTSLFEWYRQRFCPRVGCMDTNNLVPSNPFLPPEPADVDLTLPQGVVRSIGQGAWSGFRWTGFIAGPIAVILMTLGLGLCAFNLGTGMWPRAGIFAAALKFLGGAVGFFLACAFWGLVAGAVAGLVAAVIRRARGGRILASVSEASGGGAAISQWGRKTKPQSDVPGRVRGRRLWPWLVGMPILLSLAIAWAAGFHAPIYVDAALAEAIAAADRDDPNWRIDDLMAHRALVPDAENSAIVVASVSEQFPENSREEDARKCYDLLGTVAANVRLDDTVADKLRGQLDRYRQSITICRKVADMRRGRHELELGPTLIDTRLPETQSVRYVGRLLAADAALRVHDGDADGALDSCRAILGVARSIGDEPFALSQLVRIAIGRRALRSAERVVGQSEPSVNALARLQALVMDELEQPLLLYGMKGERAVGCELIRRIAAGELPMSALSGSTFDPDSPGESPNPLRALWFHYQQAIALRWLNQAVAIARRPPPERPALWAKWQAEWATMRQSRIGIFKSMLPLILLAGLPANNSAQSRYLADLGTTAILLAAERQRRQTGRWPTSIGNIDPAFLPVPPVHPFSGHAYRMNHRDGHLLVYSVGANLKIDEGVYEPKRSLEGIHDDVGVAGWDVSKRRQPSPESAK